jgi:hypothetical protein
LRPNSHQAFNGYNNTIFGKISQEFLQKSEIPHVCLKRDCFPFALLRASAHTLAMTAFLRHCEERSDEAILLNNMGNLWQKSRDSQLFFLPEESKYSTIRAEGGCFYVKKL